MLVIILNYHSCFSFHAHEISLYSHTIIDGNKQQANDKPYRVPVVRVSSKTSEVQTLLSMKYFKRHNYKKRHSRVKHTSHTLYCQ